MEEHKSEIEIINRVLWLLTKSKGVADRYDAKIQLLAERKVRAMENLYRMGVIGETSSGKSTLINSLLNEDLLPSAVIPSSSQLVSCRKGDTRQGIVHFINKEPQILTSKKLTPQIIKKYGEELSNPRNREKVKQIEIFTPNFPFDKKLVLVDSPGLHAYGFEGHEQLTLNTMLPSIDFCLFITTCKTNSDSKTKAVLDTIAHYDKPVIIIQNMIDSIKPSLNIDGTVRKTENEVAEEHMDRVQKVVNASKIKSKVTILQYSAIWAREAQQSRKAYLLEKSGYNKLVSTIQDTFTQLCPLAENKRLAFLKQDLEKIIVEAERDSSGLKFPLGKFEYEGLDDAINEKNHQCFDKIIASLNSLKKAEQVISAKKTISESDIQAAKRECEQCTKNICQIQMDMYSAIKKLCDKLNVPATQLFDEQSHFPVMSAPSLKTTEKVEKKQRKKDGWINRGLRFLLGWAGCGYETFYITTTEIDVKASKEGIVEYFNKAYSTYSIIIKSWSKKVENAVSRIEEEIKKHRAEFKARAEKALEASEYKDIADKLKEIVRDIKLSNADSFVSPNSKCQTERLVTKEIPKFAYDLSKLANVINDRIHRLVFESAVPQNGNPENIIIGWDYYCLQNFLKRSLGKNTDGLRKDATGVQKENFIIGKQKYSVFHNPSNAESISSSSTFYANVFILISALQNGQALNQLAKCYKNKLIHKSDHLYIVVQDFQEIINAQVIHEALTSLKSIQTELGLQAQPTIMILHENPIYNLAALETQYRKRQCMKIVQNDEMAILNSLQKSSLGCLCVSPTESNNVMSIIKSFK